MFPFDIKHLLFIAHFLAMVHKHVAIVLKSVCERMYTMSQIGGYEAFRLLSGQKEGVDVQSVFPVPHRGSGHHYGRKCCKGVM